MRIFEALLPDGVIEEVLERCGVRRGCPLVIDAPRFLAGLVFHLVAGAGTSAQHMKPRTGEVIIEGALSQQRSRRRCSSR